jgi:hypothetical protein
MRAPSLTAEAGDDTRDGAPEAEPAAGADAPRPASATHRRAVLGGQLAPGLLFAGPRLSEPSVRARTDPSCAAQQQELLIDVRHWLFLQPGGNGV